MIRLLAAGSIIFVLLAATPGVARAEDALKGQGAPSAAEFTRTVDRLCSSPDAVPGAGGTGDFVRCGGPASPSACDPCGLDRRWRFFVAPYLWMSSTTGDAWVQGEKSDVDMSFFDLADDLTFGAQLYAEVRRGPWWGAVDSTYLRLADKVPLGPNQGGTGSYEADMVTLDARIGYRVWGKTCCARPVAGRCCDCREKALFAFVGARYWSLDQKVDVTGVVGAAPQTRKGDDSWVDPFLGVRYFADLSRRFAIDLRGDVGGFGIGNASEFTWQAAAYLSWKVTRSFTVIGGYRAIGLDRAEGTGTDKNGLDGVLHGPVLGFGYSF